MKCQVFCVHFQYKRASSSFTLNHGAKKCSQSEEMISRLWGKRKDDKTSYLGVSGSRGCVTFGVVHDGTIRAHHALHCSHLVAWPTRGSALGSKREKRNKGGVMGKHLQQSAKKKTEKKTRKASKKQMFCWSHQSNPCTHEYIEHIEKMLAHFRKRSSNKNHTWGYSYTLDYPFSHCSSVRGYYPSLSSGSLPSVKRGQTCVAATSATIWSCFIKPLQIYLKMCTSSDEGHKIARIFGCSVLHTYTNENGCAHRYITGFLGTLLWRLSIAFVSSFSWHVLWL